jgi:hypothetical protein
LGKNYFEEFGGGFGRGMEFAIYGGEMTPDNGPNFLGRFIKQSWGGRRRRGCDYCCRSYCRFDFFRFFKFSFKLKVCRFFLKFSKIVVLKDI